MPSRPAACILASSRAPLALAAESFAHVGQEPLMTLALSQHDQSLVAAATRALVSPLVAPSFESWLAEVNRTMKELLWADTATFMFPVFGGDVKAVSDMYTSPAMRQYMLEKQPEIERRWGARTRALMLGSFNRTSLYAERIGELYASDYYNEYLVPHRAYDVLGLTTSLGAPDRVVNLYFHHQRPTGRRFGARGASLARMLFPAFKAGVHASHTTFQRRHRLGHLADAMTTGVALADGTGRIVHRNPALVALLQSEPQRLAIESALVAAAQESALVLCAANGHAGTSQARVATLLRLRRRISGIAGVYTLTATALDHEPSAYGVAVAVLAERVERVAFPAVLLAKRFHLTPREIDVARLLNEGASNGEVARALGISTATARHHTEAVMLKLGISARARLPARLAALSAAPA